MTEDKAIAPLIPPVGEDDPWTKVARVGSRGRPDVIRGRQLYFADDVDAALTLTRQQAHDEVEKACAAERAETAHDIAENPNNEWTKELRTQHAEQIAEKDERIRIEADARHDAQHGRTVQGQRAIAAESREAALRAELAQANRRLDAWIQAMAPDATGVTELEELRDDLTTARQEIETLRTALATDSEIKTRENRLQERISDFHRIGLDWMAVAETATVRESVLRTELEKANKAREEHRVDLIQAMNIGERLRQQIETLKQEQETTARAAWEEGFKLAVGYGDNWIHFDGEQKERHWQRYKAYIAKQEQGK